MPNLALLQRIFGGISEPVLFLKDGMVEYQNEAARLALPDGLPAQLRQKDGAPEEELFLAGRSLRASRAPWEDGTLLLLRPAVGSGDLELRLPLLLSALREQLNNVMAVAQILGPELSDSRRQREYMAILNQSLFRLLRLTQSAQQGREAAEGTMALHPEGLDLAQVCRTLGEEAAGLCRSAGREFSCEVAVRELLTKADRFLLERMLCELIANAAAAAGEGGRLGVRLTAAGGRAIFSVWDNGPGMDLQALETPDLTPGPGGGLRLGLRVARHIAALHGGTLMAERGAEQGTCVTVSIPVQDVDTGVVHTSRRDMTGGFSPLMVALSNILPYGVFGAEDLE